MTLVGSRRLFLQASSIPFLPNWVPIAERQTNQQQPTIQDRPVTGEVVDPWGDPVPEAQVHAFDRTADAEAILDSATADDEGRFEFHFEPTSEIAFLAEYDSWFGFISGFGPETVADLEQIELSSQRLFGPELASTDDGKPVSAVTAWQTINDETDRVLSIEVVAASGEAPAWDLFTSDEFLREGVLSITVPSPEIYLAFDRQYLHHNEHFGDVGEKPAQAIMNWHPVRTDIPSFVPTLYPRLSAFEEEWAEFQEEVFIRLLGLPSGFGLVFSLLETLDWASDTTDILQSEASVGDSQLSDLDMNYHNTILQGWNITSTAATFGVPIRFESEESQLVQFHGTWKAGPSLGGTDAVFGSEVTLDPRPRIQADEETSNSEIASDEVLFSANFEEYGLGQYPEGWTQAGNEEQEVVDNTAGNGEKAFRMSGEPGGCWEAISHHPVPLSEIGFVRFVGRVRPTTEGSVGCHESGRGSFVLRTQSSEEWYPGDGVRLFQFSHDGSIRGADDAHYGSYQTDSWQSFRLEYRKRGEEVTHAFWVDGEQRGSVTRDVEAFEDELSAISLTSGDFTIYWDDLSIIRVPSAMA